MGSKRLRDGQFRGMCVSVVASIAVLALTAMPAQAKAASPVLEFVSPRNRFSDRLHGPLAEPVTAELAGFSAVVHCSGSEGHGEITGPRSTVSNYVFTGCQAQDGAGDGIRMAPNAKPKAPPHAEEITADEIEADLV